MTQYLSIREELGWSTFHLIMTEKQATESLTSYVNLSLH